MTSYSKDEINPCMYLAFYLLFAIVLQSLPVLIGTYIVGSIAIWCVHKIENYEYLYSKAVVIAFLYTILINIIWFGQV